MALTDVYPPDTVLDPARFTRSFPVSDTPHQALDRLSALRGEAVRNMRLLQFLARVPQACLILMLAGAVTLVWASRSAGDATLKSDFGWALFVLIGLVAMTRNHIQGYAMSPRTVPLRHAVHDLRLLLLYTGAAWGLGAFLVMPDRPAPALVLGFAALPSLALSLLLKDAKGAAAFCAPVMLTCAAAAIVAVWPFHHWVAAILLVAGFLICFLPMLQSIMQGRQDTLPLPAPR